MLRSNNVAARVFERQILTPRPGTSINLFRHFYENLCPSHTVYDLDSPDLLFRKFTDDGLFLLAFSRNHQDLVVFRPGWRSYGCKGECSCEDGDYATEDKLKFSSFFQPLYSVPLASPNEFICKDFFLYVLPFRFGLFATTTAHFNTTTSDPALDSSSSSLPPPVPGVPPVDKITFYLVRLDDGVILDDKSFCNDFVNLAHCTGAFLYDDLLSIVSLRYQTIHILQIRESGHLVEVRRIGVYCHEDDELFLQSHAQVPYSTVPH